MTLLNPDLVDEQNLTDEDVAKILALHNDLQMLFNKMRVLDPITDRSVLRSRVGDIEDIEFRMQAAWKWEQTANKHTWWFQAPHCKCPNMDNQDRFGTKCRVINGDCPLHGAA